MSPTLFNIVANAVIREFLHAFCDNDDRKEFLIDLLFYADDGVIAGENAAELQHLLDLKKFASVGLKMNADKNEAMIMVGGEVSEPISKQAYHHQINIIGKIWIENAKEKSLQFMWTKC
jgi:Reverse transcriptase (RNA-dependent DNA polymerase)